MKKEVKVFLITFIITSLLLITITSFAIITERSESIINNSDFKIISIYRDKNNINFDIIGKKYVINRGIVEDKTFAFISNYKVPSFIRGIVFSIYGIFIGIRHLFEFFINSFLSISKA